MGRAEFSAAIRGIEPWLFAYYKNRAAEESAGRAEAAGIRKEVRGERRTLGREQRAAGRAGRSALGSFLLKTPLQTQGPEGSGLQDFTLGQKLPLVQELFSGQGALGDVPLPRGIRVKPPAPKPLTTSQTENLKRRDATEKRLKDQAADAKRNRIPPGISARISLAAGFDATAREFRRQAEDLTFAADQKGAQEILARSRRAGEQANTQREIVKKLLVGQSKKVRKWVISQTPEDAKRVFGGKPTPKPPRAPAAPGKGTKRISEQDPLGLFPPVKR